MEKLTEKIKQLYSKPFVKAGIDSAIIHYISIFLGQRGYKIEFVGMDSDKKEEYKQQVYTDLENNLQGVK